MWPFKKAFILRKRFPVNTQTPYIPSPAMLCVTAAKARQIINDRTAKIHAEAVANMPKYIPQINALIEEAAERGDGRILISADRDTWIRSDHWEAVKTCYKARGFSIRNNYDYLHIVWA